MEGLVLSEQDLFLLEKYRVKLDVSNGYFRIYFDNKYEYLHRFIIKAKKGEIVDHINRNKKDNRRENLRVVSAKLNSYNRKVVNNLGRGIYYDKFGNRYRACISNNNKTLKLGSFKNIVDAKKAYNLKSIEIYGENAFQHII
jgi:hypothetical protein